VGISGLSRFELIDLVNQPVGASMVRQDSFRYRPVPGNFLYGRR
jgi:hypothetical protein